MLYSIEEIQLRNVLYCGVLGYTTHPYVQPPPRFLYYEDHDVTQLITGKKILTKRATYLLQKFRRFSSSPVGFRKYMQNMNIADGQKQSFKSRATKNRDSKRRAEFIAKKGYTTQSYTPYKLSNSIITGIKPLTHEKEEAPLEPRSSTEVAPIVRKEIYVKGHQRYTYRFVDFIKFVRASDNDVELEPIENNRNVLRCNVSRKVLKMCGTRRCKTIEQCRNKVANSGRFNKRTVVDKIDERSFINDAAEHFEAAKKTRQFTSEMIEKEMLGQFGGCVNCIKEKKANYERYVRYINEIRNCYDRFLNEFANNPYVTNRLMDFIDILDVYTERFDYEDHELVEIVAIESLAKRRVKEILRRNDMDVERAYFDMMQTREVFKNRKESQTHVAEPASARRAGRAWK